MRSHTPGPQLHRQLSGSERLCKGAVTGHGLRIQDCRVAALGLEPAPPHTSGKHMAPRAPELGSLGSNLGYETE